MTGLTSAFTSWKSIVALSFGGLVLASCSHEDGDGISSMEEYKAQVYNKAFAEEFGTPAEDHNWGFASLTMAPASIYSDSYEFFNRAITRAEAENVTSVNSVTYNTFNDVMKNETAKCYYYLKIDNRIVLQEQHQVMSNPSADFFPKDIKLNNNTVQDYLFSTDNEGEIYTKVFDKIANVRDGGVSYATSSDPIPAELFKKAPSFETMALHVPDATKIKIAGSVEKFDKDYKIFWYVAKWQGNGDKKIHVDGVVVPKDQITINVPEYKKRIIVEDLKGNISENTQVKSSDFDFNDVVFDAIVWSIFNDKTKENETHLKVLVRAAGGLLPIYVAGKEIHQGGVGYMFNTSNPNYDYAKVLIEDEIIGTGDAATFDFNSIPVEIEVDGVKTAAGSDLGKAPEKIAVGVDYQWCKERQNIKDVYPKFIDYVGDKTIDKWWK
jgi:hypothetical protein